MIATTIIENSFVISAITATVWFALQPGELLGGLTPWLDRLLARTHMLWARRPLYGCSVCMGGLWTVALYPLLFGPGWEWLVAVPVTVAMNLGWALVLKLLER